MSEQIDVSVVISTFNRAGLLPTALESVARQQAGGPPYEIIVVDNNSTDHTRAVVESFIAAGHPHVRYLFEPRQGVSNGRNTGIANARGAIIAFTDDDVAVSPDWVAQIKRALDAHPEVDFVGGKVLPRWPQEPPVWLTREHWSPLAITDHGEQPFYVNRERPWCLVCANLGVRRTAFERFGGFAPEFWRSQDHEWQLRVWRAGRQGMYLPEILVEANVQRERMKKKYHRWWHTVHGKYCAMMRLEANLPDKQIRDIPPDLTTLFGTPGYVYRKLLKEGGRWLAAMLSRRGGQAFWHESNINYYVSYIREAYRENAAARRHSRLAELRLLLSAVLHKRL